MFNAYEIGVSIVLRDQVSKILRGVRNEFKGLSRDIKNMDGDITRLTKRLTGLGGLKIAGGFALGGAALGGLAFAQAAGGRKLQDAMLKGRAQGIPSDVLQTYLDQSWANTKIKGARVEDNLTLMQALHTTGFTAAQVKAMSPALTKQFLGYKAVNPGANPEDFFELARAVQQSSIWMNPEGIGDPSKFTDAMKAFMAMSTASAGQIDTGDLKAFMARTGAAGRFLTQDGLYGLYGMIQDQGGSATGTRFATATAKLIGGNLTKSALESLKGAGLIDPSKVESIGKGGFRLTTGALAGEKLWQQDPRRWMVEVGIPTMAKHVKGVDPNNPFSEKSRNAMSNEVMHWKVDRNFKDFFIDMIEGYQQLAKDYDLVKQAGGVDVFGESQSTFTTKLQNMKASWSNFVTALSESDGVHKLMDDIASSLNQATAWVRANPDFPQKLQSFLLGLSAAFIGIAAALTTGVIIGLIALAPEIALAATVIGAAIGAIFYYWDSLKGWFVDFSDGIWVAGDLIKTKLGRLGEIIWWFVEHLPFGLGGVIKGAEAYSEKNGYGSLAKGVRGLSAGERSDLTGVENYYDAGQRKIVSMDVIREEIRAANQRPIVLNNRVELDGRVIASSTERILGDKLNRGQTGPSGAVGNGTLFTNPFTGQSY